MVEIRFGTRDERFSSNVGKSSARPLGAWLSGNGVSYCHFMILLPCKFECHFFLVRTNPNALFLIGDTGTVLGRHPSVYVPISRNGSTVETSDDDHIGESKQGHSEAGIGPAKKKAKMLL
jgi:hypothetical protein